MARAAALPGTGLNMADHCLALEIGGTALRAAMVNRDGNISAAHRADTPAGGGAAILEALTGLGSNVVAATGIAPAAVGISSAGVIDTVRGVVAGSGETLPGWKGTALASPISAHFGCPAYAANDAQCALEGELWKGGHATDDEAPIVLLTLGTGLGGAWALGGRLVRGHSLRAGHFGSPRHYHPLLARETTLEETVSGSGLAVLHRALHGHETHFREMRGPALMEALIQGDRMARATVQVWTREVANLVASLRWTLDPALVILGGGVIGSRQVWWPQLAIALDALNVDTPLAPAALGESAGLVGAAHMAWSHCA